MTTCHAMARVGEQDAQSAFRDAQELWRGALEAHRLAPPDAGFSVRLSGLADAARAEAQACRVAEGAGFEWPPHRASSSAPPYELQPGSGRRGPEELWRRFDAAVSELNRAATGTDLLAVAVAYDELAEAAGELAVAVEREDRASGLLPRLARAVRRRALVGYAGFLAAVAGRRCRPRSSVADRLCGGGAGLWWLVARGRGGWRARCCRRSHARVALRRLGV